MKKIIALTLLVLPFTVFAHDGNHCSGPFFQNQKGVTTGIQALSGQYDTGTDEFDYFMTSLEAGYNYKNRFFSTVRVPFVSLENNQNRDFLLSDVQVQLQGSFLTWGETNFMSLGMNTEIPTGNEDKLVGGGHLHFRPYLGFQQNLGKVITYGQVGFLFAAKEHDASTTDHPHEEGEEEGHHEEVIHGSVVDVHSGREGTFQLGGVFPITHGLFFNFAMAGQTVLTNTNASVGDFYMTANPALTLMLTESSTITMFTQLPVTTLQRFDYRLGAGINYIF